MPSELSRRSEGLLGSLLPPLGNLLGGLEGFEEVISLILGAPRRILETLATLLRALIDARSVQHVTMLPLVALALFLYVQSVFYLF